MCASSFKIDMTGHQEFYGTLLYSGLYTSVQLISSYNNKKQDKASWSSPSLTQQSLIQKAPEEKVSNTQPLSVKIQTQSKIYNSHIPVLKNRHLLASLWMLLLQYDMVQ